MKDIDLWLCQETIYKKSGNITRFFAFQDEKQAIDYKYYNEEVQKSDKITVNITKIKGFLS